MLTDYCFKNYFQAIAIALVECICCSTQDPWKRHEQHEQRRARDDSISRKSFPKFGRGRRWRIDFPFHGAPIRQRLYSDTTRGTRSEQSTQATHGHSHHARHREPVQRRDASQRCHCPLPGAAKTRNY